MTLLERMKAIDTSGIAAARLDIEATVSLDGVQDVIERGVAECVLGTLGAALGQAGRIGDPGALLEPLVAAVAELHGALATDGLPIEDYGRAIREAADMVASVVRAIGDGDLSKATLPNGKSLGEMASLPADLVGRYASLDMGAVGDLRAMIDAVDGGVSAHADATVRLSLQLLLPFDAAPLGAMRASVDAILDGSLAIRIPDDVMAGLTAAMDGVAAAAVTGDAARLNAALRDLERARQNALERCRRALAGYVQAFEALDLPEHLAVLADASQSLKAGDESVLAIMARIKAYLIDLRALVEGASDVDLTALLAQIGDRLEATLRAAFEAPVDRTVARTKAWLRDALAQLGLRAHRNEITAFVHGVATAVAAADFDGPAEEARAALKSVAALLDGDDLAAEIQAGLLGVKDTAQHALAKITDGLEAIVGQVNTVAGEANAVLDEMATLLAAFEASVGAIEERVGDIDFDQAGAEVVGRLKDLRVKAEQLLSVAPLPDALRPVIEQLIAQLEAMDFEPVLAPVKEAAASLRVPPSLVATVDDALDEAARLVRDLVTPELVASLESATTPLLDGLETLDPAALLDDVRGYLDQAADAVAGIDPRPAVAQLRAPFDAVLDAIDAVRPQRLLGPVIDAYDALLASIELPSPETWMHGASDMLDAAGEQLAAQLSRPLDHFSGGQSGLDDEGASGGRPASASAFPSAGASGAPGMGGPSSGAPTGVSAPPSLEAVRAGDVIRLLGYLPGKLREALVALESGELGIVLGRIDAMAGGLARDVRRVSAELWAAEERLLEQIDTLVLPLGDAQIRAQLAIGAHFQAGGVQLDASAAVSAVATCGPGPVRAALADELSRAREDARGFIRQTGGSLGAVLDHAADALERTSLAALAADAEALLAALDPEPVAAELDNLMNAVLARAARITADASEALESGVRRFVDLLRIFNPVGQAEKFVSVLDVLREELDVLDPRRLAAELGEVHLAIRGAVAAYDPERFAQEIFDVAQGVAQQLRSIDPAMLLGDLDVLGDVRSALEGAMPAAVLTGLDGTLEEVGDRLAVLDLAGVVASLDELPERAVGAIDGVLEGIRAEVKALLQSIRYASTAGTVSVSVHAEVNA